MASVAASWTTIEGVLWENAHSVYRALRKPATDAQISRLRKMVPTKLPQDFVQSLKTHDGLRNSYLGPIRLFDYNALLPISTIITEYKTLSGLQVECGFHGGLSDGDSRVRNDFHWRLGWLPFMDADGDKLVLDLDPAPSGSVGQVFAWSNTGSSPIRVLAPSFGEWLAGLAESLDKRKFALNEQGSISLDGVPGGEPLHGQPP